MAAFIISYDLPQDGDYNALIEKIKSYGTWAHVTLSTWAVVSDKTALDIRDDLKAVIPSEGRLLVVQSANIAAWKNTICTNDWLQKNI